MTEHYVLNKDGNKIAIYTYDNPGLTAARSKMTELVNSDYTAAQSKYSEDEYDITIQSPTSDISGVRIQQTKQKSFEIPCSDITQTPVCIYTIVKFTNVA